jgi:predicted ArsR family transcriptional regulator
MSSAAGAHLPLAQLEIPLERDVFLRTLLHHLAGTLQEVIGLDEAAGFIALVGQRIGDELDHAYRDALAVPKLSRAQLSAVLVDLKRRIQGDFFVIEETEDKIVLENRCCPFGELVVGRPALCRMTSSVFGSIAAENLGYAKVDIERAIARGDRDCRVVVYLRPTAESQASGGHEFVRD